MSWAASAPWRVAWPSFANTNAIVAGALGSADFITESGLTAVSITRTTPRMDPLMDDFTAVIEEDREAISRYRDAVGALTPDDREWLRAQGWHDNSGLFGYPYRGTQKSTSSRSIG